MPYLVRPRKIRAERAISTPRSRALLAEFDKSLENLDEARSKTIRQLRAPLSKIPRKERGVGWVERVVLAYCTMHLRSGRVRSLRRSIIEHWKSQGEPERADAFKARVDEILSAHTSSLPPFFLNFASSDKAAAAQDLRKVITALETHGYKVFINSGTLLGAVRSQSFLPHDDDVDIGILIPTTTQSGAAMSMLDLHSELKKILDYPIKTSFNSPVLKIKTPADFVIDLFPVWFEDEKLFVWPHTFGELEKADLFPLQQLQIHGHDMPAPAAPEKMLELNYGPNWLVPDTGFTFPWAEAKLKFATMLELYRRKVKHKAVLEFFR